MPPIEIDTRGGSYLRSGDHRQRAVSLFSWSVEQNARDTHANDHARDWRHETGEVRLLLGLPPSFLAPRSFAPQRSRSRAPPLLNLKKKRDSLQSKAIKKREEGPPDGRLGWSLSEVCHILGSFFYAPQSQIMWKCCETGPFIPCLEGLSGVCHQPSDGLKIQQPSTVKKGYFFTVNSH